MATEPTALSRSCCRRSPLLPSRVRQMEEHIGGHHQRQVDNRDHVHGGSRKAVAGYVKYHYDAAHTGSCCQHTARLAVRPPHNHPISMDTSSRIAIAATEPPPRIVSKA